MGIAQKTDLSTKFTWACLTHSAPKQGQFLGNCEKLKIATKPTFFIWLQNVHFWLFLFKSSARSCEYSIYEVKYNFFLKNREFFWVLWVTSFRFLTKTKKKKKKKKFASFDFTYR